MRNTAFLNPVLAVAFIFLTGWLLLVGRTIVLPIFAAIISVYVLASATETLRKLPVVRSFPMIVLRVIVVGAFAMIVFAFAGVITATVRDISAVAPTYQANLDTLLNGHANRLDLEASELWKQIDAMTLDRIDLPKLVLGMLGSFTSLGATFFLTIVYAGFLMGERETFDRKISAAFPESDQAEALLAIKSRINEQIRSYITMKTLINIMLGGISYCILWLMGIDFALFWALMIGLLNYIPYVGSYVAVAFPVFLSLAQFGDLAKTALLVCLLAAVQMFIGNIFEPRMIGRQLNLSPFIVLVSLSVWTALWGLPGAILAVPLTSILVIIAASFDATRPAAILLSDRVDPPTPQ
jgi:predicted PurR-regulated permease PerM